MTQKSSVKTIFSLHERGRGRKPIWNSVGSAFENRDGSLSVVIQCIPLQAFTEGELRLQIRERKSNVSDE